MRPSELIIRCIDWFYIRPIASILPLQTFRYAVCGGFNVVLGWVLYFSVYNYLIDKQFVDLRFVMMSPHVAAMFVIFPVTFFVGFWLNRKVAFRWSPLKTATQLVRYALTVGGSVVVNYLCLKFFVEVCAIWATPSQVLAGFVTMFYSYFAAKYFTFRNAVSE